MKAPEHLYQQFFESDSDGRPMALFKIRCKDTKQGEIINPDHSALVLPYLKKVDAWIDISMNRVKELSGIEFTALFEECEQVNKHAHGVAAQAFYLDTADRNSWVTIQQVMMAMPNGLTLTSSAKTLRDYMKFVDLEAHAERVARKSMQNTTDDFTP